MSNYVLSSLSNYTQGTVNHCLSYCFAYILLRVIDHNHRLPCRRLPVTNSLVNDTADDSQFVTITCTSSRQYAYVTNWKRMRERCSENMLFRYSMALFGKYIKGNLKKKSYFFTHFVRNPAVPYSMKTSLVFGCISLANAYTTRKLLGGIVLIRVNILQSPISTKGMSSYHSRSVNQFQQRTKWSEFDVMTSRRSIIRIQVNLDIHE